MFGILGDLIGINNAREATVPTANQTDISGLTSARQNATTA